MGIEVSTAEFAETAEITVDNRRADLTDRG